MFQTVATLKAVKLGAALALSVIANVDQAKVQHQGHSVWAMPFAGGAPTVVTTPTTTPKPQAQAPALISGVSTTRRSTETSNQGGISGRVVLRLQVKPNGQIKSIEVVQKLSAALDQRAIEEAKLMRFEPWEESTMVQVTITFSIPQ